MAPQTTPTVAPSVTSKEHTPTLDTRDTPALPPASRVDSDMVASVEPTTSTPPTALASPTAQSPAPPQTTTATPSSTQPRTSPPSSKDTPAPTERSTGESILKSLRIE